MLKDVCLGEDMTLELDRRFGACLVPNSVREDEYEGVPITIHKLNPESGALLNNYLESVAKHEFGKLIHGATGILWVVDESGVITFALEEVYNRKNMKVAFVFPRKSIDLPEDLFKLGHPSLLPPCDERSPQKKLARLGGDILFDPKMSKENPWYITRNSGRYGWVDSFKLEFLEAVAEEFNRNGVRVTPYD